MIGNVFSRTLRSGSMLVVLGLFGSASPAFAMPFAAPDTVADVAPPGVVAATNTSTPEFDAFRKAWAGVVNYACTIVAHETNNDGTRVENRTFRFEFIKPSAALIVVTAGSGKGGAAAWNGGSTVRGHKGGFASFIKLTLPINDPRVTSLRGDQINVASFGYEVDRFSTTPGTLSETKTTDGTVVTLALSRPDATGITRETLTLSPLTHLPVKHEAFARDRTVKSETFSDLKLNDPNLKATDIAI